MAVDILEISHFLHTIITDEDIILIENKQIIVVSNDFISNSIIV